MVKQNDSFKDRKTDMNNIILEVSTEKRPINRVI